MLSSGDILNGRFEVINKIEEGGMGVVYLGEDLNTGEKCVIKHPKDLSNSKHVEKLEVEAKILSSIKHPNIVGYIDFFLKENNIPCLVLDFIQGKLFQDIFLKNPAPESEVINYTTQLLDTVIYLHNNNIIHRDIKPKNIFLSNDNIVLIDFGGAKYGYTNLGNSILYTPCWCAPEQQSGDCFFQSDIFAIGTFMYFLLTGEFPGTPPLSPKSVNPRVSDTLDNIVFKATQFNKDKRFQTVGEMKNVLMGKPVHPLAYDPRIIIGSNIIKLVRDKMVIGRGDNADIKINDPNGYISRKHAIIYRDSQGQYRIEDNKTVNHTFIYINGHYIQKEKWALSDGDLIALCYSDSKGPYLQIEFRIQ